MTKQIAIIDPFVKSPVINCFNGLVNMLGLQATYHAPSLSGLQTLQLERDKTHAYMILGSASNVDDYLPWHAPLAQFMEEELRRGKPVMGCCFGHQLMCHQFGSEVVFYHENQEKLLGKREIKIEKDFWDFKKGESFHIPVTHRQYVKSLGPDLLSVGTGLPNDIVIHRTLPFIGTQGHPEASDYFCKEDIKILSDEEQKLAQNDGRSLILRFFKHFQIL